MHQIDSTNDLQQQFFGGSAHPSEAALTRVGRQALDRFMAATPGLQQLRAKPGSARTAAWLAARTRWAPRPGAGAAQRAELHRHQLSEAIICKRWLVRTYDELCTRFRYGWDGDVVIVLWVHDELVCCCRPEIAEQVGEIMVRHAKEPANSTASRCRSTPSTRSAAAGPESRSKVRAQDNDRAGGIRLTMSRIPSLAYPIETVNPSPTIAAPAVMGPLPN